MTPIPQLVRIAIDQKAEACAIEVKHKTIRMEGGGIDPERISGNILKDDRMWVEYLYIHKKRTRSGKRGETVKITARQYLVSGEVQSSVVFEEAR
jgi:hypothetical protein